MTQAVVQKTDFKLEQMQAEQAEKKQKDPKESAAQENAMLYAFLMIVDSVGIVRESAQIQSESLENNAAAQQELINQTTGYRYSTLSSTEIKALDNAKDPEAVKKVTGQLQNVTMKNEQVQKVLSYYNNMIILTRQQASVAETGVSTKVSTAQQSLSVASSLMTMLRNLSNKVTQM